jgi:hypothetical protein
VLSSFFLMCAAVPVSFMGWFWGLVGRVAFLGNAQLVFIAAVAVLGLAALLSSLKKLPVLAEVLLLVILPIAVVVAFHFASIADFQKLLGLQPARAGWR